jgi:hypothetical protein
MKDALGEPTSGLIVKLRRSSDHLSAGTNGHVTIELQDTSGRSIALMSVPEDQLHQELSRILKPYVLMSPEGLISASLEESTLELGAEEAISIDQVIADAISPDMLDDEPEAAEMLSKFRDRLLKSLEHIEKAIASLPKD